VPIGFSHNFECIDLRKSPRMVDAAPYENSSDTKIMTAAGDRFWEIDFLRGLAILMMIFFHALWDLDYFGIFKVDVHAGFWLIFARATAILFLLLVGVSLTLGRSLQKRDCGTHFAHYLRRGATLFSLGMAVTFATWVSLGEGFVVYGVLHLIGTATVLAYPLLKFRVLNLILGGGIMSVGFLFRGMRFDFPWLLWLGFPPRHFHSVDYFPILPWFGVVLIGLFLGRTLYQDRSRTFVVPDLSDRALARYLAILGRNSLLIYLVHQPLLIATICLLGCEDVLEIANIL